MTESFIKINPIQHNMALTELLFQKGQLVNREGVEVQATPVGEPRTIYATERMVRELPTSMGSVHPSRVAGADERTWKYWVLENEANAYDLRKSDEGPKQIEIQGEPAEAYELQLYKTV